MAKLYFNSARGIGGSLRAWPVDLTHGTDFSCIASSLFRHLRSHDQYGRGRSAVHVCACVCMYATHTRTCMHARIHTCISGYVVHLMFVWQN